MTPAELRHSPVATRPRLRFDQTVPRALAHRRALAEVYVCDSAQVGDEEFVLALQVPRAHSLWFDRHGAHHDPFSVAEACRQGAFVVVHRYLRIPQGLPFSLQRVEFRVEDLGAYRDDGANPLEAICELRLDETHREGETLVALSFRGDLTIGATPAMTMSGALVFLPPDDYEVLRAHQRGRKSRAGAGARRPVPPVEPALVGRRDERNVVIAEPAEDHLSGELRFPVVVDETHPFFFDHEQDHLPGPLIVEAYRQSAIFAARRAGRIGSPVATVVGCRASFSDFAELDADTECAAIVRVGEGPRVCVDIALLQLGKRIAEAKLELVEGA